MGALRLKKTGGRSAAFTLVELMIVVVIVAILAMVAVPIYRANVTNAKMSEGIAGVGSIRTAFRIYAASHDGDYPVLTAVDGDGLDDLNVDGDDLDGKYFESDDYEVTSTASTYTIKATEPDSSETYIINQAGVESGTYTTGH